MATAASISRRIALSLALPLWFAGCTAEVPLTRTSQADLPSAGQARTTLVTFDTTPFPFHGTVPGATKPFMDVNDNGRLGHSSLRNGTLWEDRVYNDRRVLLSIPAGFDPRRPAVLVVFLHGNGATLERDVRDRQGVPRQIARSGLNAVLVAPQFAVDAKDSSAGRFWEAGVFARFLEEAAHRLAEFEGTSEGSFDRAPVILVGYSGGYLPAAAALRYGEVGERVRGVVLLDALYGEADTFASWIEGRGEGFFVSLYGVSSKPGNEAMERRLAANGIGFSTALQPIGPGSVTFIDAGASVPHGDMVTAALGGDPLAQIFRRIDGFGHRPGEAVATR